MATEFRVDVVEEDFDLGEMKNSNRCAVKRAVARCIPGSTRVEVDLQTVRFTLNSERHVFLTPWAVGDYVIAYDAGDEDQLEPFSFRLRPSQEVGSQVRRKVFTDEGKKVDAARNRIRKAKAKKDRATTTLETPDASPVERAQAEEVLATVDEDIVALQQEYEDVREARKKTGVPAQKRIDSDKPRPPRKYKQRSRHFGRRELRVNQEDGRTHTPSVRMPQGYNEG